MAYTFSPEELFSKGIVYAEFFDPATDDLLGFSKLVSGFNPQGSVNAGDVEGGPGNALVMQIHDTARLNISATTADSALNNMALTVGGTLTANGVIETTKPIIATAATLTIANAVAPLGGQNGAVAYVIGSTGSDKAAVAAASGTAYPVSEEGVISGFTAVPGNTYCVKYFTHNSSAIQLGIPSLFTGKIVRAHFAVNLYAKKAGNDVMASSLLKIRHYVFPYYSFTNPLNDTLSQTATGSVDLSGTCLAYQDTVEGACVSAENAGVYGYIVDEYVGNESSTAGIDGIYFIGLGAGASLAVGDELAIPVRYSVDGILAPISDMSQVTFASSDATKASFADSHSNVLTGVAQGSATLTVSVTNSRTGVAYSDTIPVTVTAG